MAYLEEVEGKDNVIISDEEDEYTSSSDEDSDIDEEDEELLSRIIALRDIVPPETRARISTTASSLFSKSFDLLKTIGNSAWVLVTAASILALPVVLEIEREQAAIHQENQRAQQQQLRQQQLLSRALPDDDEE
ncbi:hypothetical protein BCR32DRAFT_297875 [Anaeromyces robustus]|uniref:Mitochondrial import translocase, subunit Tom22 n=1 Tax=Anaeromyces robustus TaxID=1754192 RepID=A0A1Y1VW14_9FUNG|nr:hypothetical protein BCR32DRAFT_297875 [Anaeromyces robustus]|eukprot:ORX64944.1 hypothetical protein BCR32DRAFT_297875 [Anaeromyces robustus]